MGDEKKPDDKKQDKKQGKKLELNRETVQELSDQDLDKVAGGVGGKTGRCNTSPNVCRESADANCPPDTAGCSPNPDPPSLVKDAGTACIQS